MPYHFNDVDGKKILHLRGLLQFYIRLSNFTKKIENHSLK